MNKMCFFTKLQTDLLHVNQQGLLVVLPLDGKLTGMRELVTWQLHRHLKAVGVQVTEVIHTCGKEEADLKAIFLTQKWEKNP